MTEAVTVMPRAEYELYVSGDGSHRLTYILGQLNEFISFSWFPDIGM